MGVLGELNTTPSGPKAKGKNKTPLKSPHAAPLGVLSPNNDALEKRRNKLARQASETQKRSFTEALDEVRADAEAPGKSPLGRQTSALSRSSSIASANASRPPRRPAVLSAESVLNLYSNCIKLASENKINAKNTWSLAPIDHISEIVRDSKDEDGQTNFQKSSCTLDAGVKIYASRVDSFHNETFKMLGGMNKVATVEEGEEEEGGGFETAKGDGEGLDGEGAPLTRKKRSARAVATLEPPTRTPSRGWTRRTWWTAVPKDQRAVRRGRRLGLAAQQPLRAPRVQHLLRLGGGAGVPRRFSDE